MQHKTYFFLSQQPCEVDWAERKWWPRIIQCVSMDEWGVSLFWFQTSTTIPCWLWNRKMYLWLFKALISSFYQTSTKNKNELQVHHHRCHPRYHLVTACCILNYMNLLSAFSYKNCKMKNVKLRLWRSK